MFDVYQGKSSIGNKPIIDKDKLKKKQSNENYYQADMHKKMFDSGKIKIPVSRNQKNQGILRISSQYS